MSIQDREGVVNPRVYRHPVDRVIEEEGHTLWRISEVAEMLGKSEYLIRTATKKGAVKAPSKVYVSGKMVVNLYTQEDVDELREYLS